VIEAQRALKAKRAAEDAAAERAYFLAEQEQLRQWEEQEAAKRQAQVWRRGALVLLTECCPSNLVN